MLVYHGSKTSNISELNPRKMNIGNNQEGIGTYFTPDISIAKGYGSFVYELNINKKNYVSSRSSIGDIVPLNIISGFIYECNKTSNKFWYLFTDYGIEVDSQESVKSKHCIQIAKMMRDQEVRNFQIEICQQGISVSKFIKNWRKYIPNIHGTFNKDIFCVLFENTRVKLLERSIKKQIVEYLQL